ncbi:MAG: NAD(P)H-hydrate dehydratase [Actinomycetia bacterium]|nr:NAD(P)H-hydrate dehydratase [Actinomycetes bacterium]
MNERELELVEDPPPMPSRPSGGHKGTFGTTLVVGGATGPRRMLGGPCLAARAALRSGCGLAVLGVPESLATAALSIVPEATGIPLPIADVCEGAAIEAVREAGSTAHAIVCGPGLGSPTGIEALVDAVTDLEDRPRVLDADALNALARSRRVTLHGPIVLTPHPGEWNRLARRLGIERDAISDVGRPEAAAELARRFDGGGGPVVVVLKGERTVVSDGRRFWRCDAGNPALATAGSGDVLAGVLGGLFAQFHPRAGAPARTPVLDAFDLACLAVSLHAEAGAGWRRRNGDAGLLAHELADELPAARGRLPASS